MVSRTTTIVLASTGVCLGAIGIVCLALGLSGYFTYKDACVSLVSFDLVDVQLVNDNGQTNSNNGIVGSLVGAFEQFTGVSVPTRVNMTLEFVVQVNNTNTYTIEFQQDTQADNSISIVRDGDSDLQLGSWTMEPTQLGGRQGKDFPLTVHTSLDLENSAMTKLLAGDTTFRMQGTVLGSGWVPGVSGSISLDCTVTVTGIINGELQALACMQSQNVPGSPHEQSVNVTGDQAVEQASSIMSEEDTSCYV